MTILRSSALGVFWVLLSACAANGARQASVAPTGSKNVDEQALNESYARMADAVRRYEAGLALANQGQADAAGIEVGAAQDLLQAEAERCVLLPGCEIERALESYSRLLRVQSTASQTDAAVAELADPAAGTETVGESAGVVAELPEAGRTVALLNGRQLGDIIALNGPVKAALEEWLTQLRPNLIDAWENYQYLRYRMRPEYEEARLPEALLFGMLAKESGGKVHAVSRAGASGPLQFMYHTGLRYGLNRVNGFDMRFDPTAATRANAAYLNEQLRLLNNDLALVLAAYNGGEGRMQRLARRAPGKGFWDPNIYNALPPETRDYVPMVLAAAWLYMHPERYGLEWPRLDAAPGKVKLGRSASISELTICLGQEGGSRDGWFRTLRNLNPSFDPQHPLPAGTTIEVPAVLVPVYATRCADGEHAALAAELHAATLPAVARKWTASGSTYVVRKGDTLASISRRFKCGNHKSLAAQNGIRAPGYSIRAGQKLQIGSCGRA